MDETTDQDNTRDNIYGAVVGTLFASIKRFRERRPNETYAAKTGLKPLVYADDNRYGEQEIGVTVNSHIKPCVIRFIALCHVLRCGFKAAQLPPVDLNVGMCKWVAGCLELMLENPLLHAENSWKTSLSVIDEENIVAAFKGAAEEMVRWVNAVRQQCPSLCIGEWQGLVESVFHALTRGKDTSGNGPIQIDHFENLVLRQSPRGNLQIDDSTIRTILGGCSQRGASREYAQYAVPEGLAAQVDAGNAAFEYDPYFQCFTSDHQMRLTFIFMEELIASYNKTNEVAIRRAAFTLDDAHNEWFKYYLHEYCQPTLPLLALANDPDLVEADFRNNIAALEERFQIACDLVMRDSNRSPEARAMRSAWEALYGKFTLRGRFGSLPSYKEQCDFALELQKFFGLFKLAVDTIGQPPVAPATEPPTEQKPKPLAIPGGQLERFNQRCKWIVECLEEYRVQLRTAYKDEFERGITKHLGLPTVKHIVNWIQQKHDSTITRREIDRVLLDALGTTPSAYAHTRNVGRQRREAARQGELSKRALKTGERGLETKSYPVTDHPERINPRLVMYWDKLPTDANFILLTRQPTTFSGFDTKNYIAGLKATLHFTPNNG